MAWERFARRSGVLLALVILLSGCSAAPPPAAPATAPAATRPSTAAEAATPGASATFAPTATAPAEPAATATAGTPPAAPTAAPTNAPTAPAAPTLTRALRQASPPLQGDDVRAAQGRLRELGYAQVGEADGIFGPNTEAAVRAFQTLNDLAVDGVVGPRTWERLFSADAVIPNVAPVVDADSGWLLGSSQAGKWLGAATTASLLRGGESYRLYSQAGAAGTSVGSKPANPPGPCGDLFTVELTPRATVTTTLALAGDWNPLPRTPVDLAADAPAHRQAIADLLRANGIPKPDVRLTRAVRVDLEGDGSEETVIAATRYANADALESLYGTAVAGDYSVVAISRTVNGHVETILATGDIYPKPRDYSAPAQFDLRGMLDLNGDGRMEIVVDSQWYEGGGIDVYDVAGSKIGHVFTAVCGV